MEKSIAYLTTDIVELSDEIRWCTSELRDTFPDNLPYLWEKISPIIENIEGCATTIKKISRRLRESEE